MASGAAPIVFEEQLSLPALGISAGAISFNTVTMESDKHICVREPSGTDQQQQQQQQGSRLVIIDTANPKQPLRRPISADSAIMNPVSQVIALKSGGQLQLFDIGTKQKVKSHVLSDGDVAFWKWVSPHTLGLVTAQSVYTWSVDSSGAPSKLFDRHASLSGCQIINLRAGANERWWALVGIRADESAAGGVAGKIQLFSADRGVSQPIDGHAAAFYDSYKIDSRDKSGTRLFVFANRSKFHVVEVAQDKKPADAPRFEKRVTSIYYPPESGNDFPIALQTSSKYAVAYLLTKFGYIHAFDLETGKAIYTNRISESPVFVTAAHDATGGIIGVNRKGQVLSFALDPAAIVEYILEQLKDLDLAIKVAARNGLPGADELFERQFRRLFDEGQYKEAARVVADSPAGRLRSPGTVQQFKAAPAPQGSPSPLLVYFQTLLERGSLNEDESVELGRQVIAFSRLNLLERWMKENRIACTEELGDLVRSANDPRLALAVYVKAGAHQKAIQGLVETGEYKKATEYAQRNNVQVDAVSMLRTAVAANPKGALELAESLASDETDHNAVADIFLQRGHVQEATSYLLDALKEDRAEQGALQTKVLEINLTSGAPQVADAIIAQEMFTHYDRARVAALCERAGLYQRALEHYTDLADAKRVVVNCAHAINPEFVTNYFSNLSPDDGLELLEELLASNPRDNLQLVVQVAIRYSATMGAARLIDMFERRGAYDGEYYYLGATVSTSSDPEVHYKYVEAACRAQQWQEAERITRESTVFEPERVKALLFELKPRDPRPLINVCDRFGYVDEMVRLFVKNGQLKFIEGYVQRVNPSKAPAVVGTLLDMDAANIDDAYIKSLLMGIKNTAPVRELVVECEKRNKMKLLLQLLEALVADGSRDESVHTALAKVYVDANINPEHFLETNEYYDSLAVGEFCERRDPYLAVVAYARGKCDDRLLDVTNANSMMREQARYVVDRQDLALWSRVLSEDNSFRKPLVDQVVGNALTETKSPEKVSVAVKAFMAAGMQSELLELLEKLVLQSGGAFANNTSLQNLLILTAVKSDPTRVSEYVRRLDAYDGASIAEICAESGLYEEAFTVYAKIEMYSEAVGVLADELEDFRRALDFASKVDRADVWVRLGDGYLRAGEVGAAVDAFVRADDALRYKAVIGAASEAGAFAELVKYLVFVRGKQLGVDEELVDNEILYALARCKPPRLGDLEEFLAAPHAADLDTVGDRLFAEEQFQAARILFTAADNQARLAECLVRLGDYVAAVEAARRADKLRTWRYVCFACVEAEQWRFAEMCALHIVVVPEELDEVVRFYETRGLFAQIIAALENSLGLDKAHAGLFTELGVLYSKYDERKMMEHIKIYYARANVPKLIRAAENAHLWAELVFLHLKYEEYDNAALTMMDHAPRAWSHQGLLEILAVVNNLEICYRAVSFYMDEHPQLINELLAMLQARVDPSRIMSMARRHGAEAYGPLGHLPLIKPYIQKVQEKDVPEVNDALNEIVILEEDVDALRASVDRYQNFDQIGLAQRLERHERLQFRRLALTLLRRNKKFERALELCKTERLYRDAAETAAESNSPEMAESLARYFLQNKLAEGFSAVLYACYSLLRPDVVLELTWRAGTPFDYSMPFFIQTMRDMGTRIEALERAERERKQEKREAVRREEEQANDANVVLRGLSNAPMLTAGGPPPPSAGGGVGGYGMSYPPPPPPPPPPYY